MCAYIYETNLTPNCFTICLDEMKECNLTSHMALGWLKMSNWKELGIFSIIVVMVTIPMAE